MNSSATERVVSIVLNRGWKDTCHHINNILYEVCSSIHDCLAMTPISVEGAPCKRGVCVCLMHGSASKNTTEVSAHAWLTQLGNSTTWPPWVESIVEEQKHEDPVI